MTVRGRARLVVMAVDDELECFGILDRRLVVMVRGVTMVQRKGDAAEPRHDESDAENRRRVRSPAPVHARNITTGR